jgi:hypothetical protein
MERWLDSKRVSIVILGIISIAAVDAVGFYGKKIPVVAGSLKKGCLMEKRCLCGKPIHGQANRKWCSSRCRNLHWRSRRFWGAVKELRRSRPAIRSATPPDGPEAG